MAGRVLPFRRERTETDPQPPSAAVFEARVHEMAKVSANLRFEHPHVQKQMKGRHLSMRQVLEVLRNGCVVDGPKLDKWGDWRVKLQRRVAGRRVQVVVAVKETHLDVVTAI